MSKNIVCVSGGFDPVHTGHISMFQQASDYGDVAVILNSDDWLLRKKGYFLMDWYQRAKILRAIKYVSYVVDVDDRNGSVCDTLRSLRPDFFANGGDRTETNTPEQDLCKELGINLLWNVGGGKTESSSDLVKKAWEQWRKTIGNDPVMAVRQALEAQKLIDPRKRFNRMVEDGLIDEDGTVRRNK